MTLENRIGRILQRVSFFERYRDICSRFNDLDQAVAPKKKEVEKVLSHIGVEYEYVSLERLFKITSTEFYTEFNLLFTYKYGLIEARLQALTESESVNHRWDFLGELFMENYRKSLLSPVPITNNIEDFQNILTEIINIYKDMQKEYIDEA